MPGPKDRLSIVIVGGGIGGLTAALALSRQNRRVHVVEKAPQFGEIGAGLQLAPNAMYVLDRLGLLSELGKHAVYPSRLVWMDALRAEKITEIDLGEPFKSRYGQSYIVMHRSDLLDTLLAACRASNLITLEPNRSVAGVDDLGDGARVRFADGSSYDCDMLIGADGLWSTVRGAIVQDSPVCMGYVAYRGTIPMDQMSQHAGLDNVVMWVGPDMHFVQYPLRRGELYNQVAVFRSKRYRPGTDDWGTVDELDAHYAQTCDYVQACIKLMWRDRRWSMHDREPVLGWTKNRIGLLGDAAHPMFQYIAQGACQAIEDALCLATTVTAKPDAAQALKAYEAARNLRTARVQITARAMGAYFHLQGVPAIVRNELMSRRAPTDYSMIDWLYGHRADAV